MFSDSHMIFDIEQLIGCNPGASETASNITQDRIEMISDFSKGEISEKQFSIDNTESKKSVIDITEAGEHEKECPYQLIVDDDLEFTREHYNKPIKYGVIPLDEDVFTVYTNSLLHARNALHRYKDKKEDSALP